MTLKLTSIHIIHQVPSTFKCRYTQSKTASWNYSRWGRMDPIVNISLSQLYCNFKCLLEISLTIRQCSRVFGGHLFSNSPFLYLHVSYWKISPINVKPLTLVADNRLSFWIFPAVLVIQGNASLHYTWALFECLLNP